MIGLILVNGQNIIRPQSHYGKKKFLCIITARANSKGIKKKIYKKINNKELIYYPIKAALKSKFINDVVVSTDSPKIAKISKVYGANVPFLRPKKFALDSSPVQRQLSIV